MYHTWKNIKKSYKNDKFKISALICNEEFEFPDGSYSLSDIQNYFENIFKKMEKKLLILNKNILIRIYVNKIGNRITFKIKTGYYLELSTSETMKLLGSTNIKITKNQNDENVPYLQINEVVLVHCNIVNSNYQQHSRIIYSFVPNKSFGQLLDISSKNFKFLKPFDSEFSHIEV